MNLITAKKKTKKIESGNLAKKIEHTQGNSNSPVPTHMELINPIHFSISITHQLEGGTKQERKTYRTNQRT